MLEILKSIIIIHDKDDGRRDLWRQIAHEKAQGYFLNINIEVTNQERIDVTGHVFKSCIILVRLKKTWNYDDVIEYIRGDRNSEPRHTIVWGGKKSSQWSLCWANECTLMHESREMVGGSSHGRFGNKIKNRRNHHHRDTRAKFAKNEDMGCYFCRKKSHIPSSLKSDWFSNPERNNFCGIRKEVSRNMSWRARGRCPMLLAY